MRSNLQQPLPRWRIALGTLTLGLVLAVLVGAALIYTGAYDVAATHRHWRFTEWVLETARIQSIKAHAAGIQPPPGLDDPARLPIGVEHFAAHCAVCHGAPGVPKGDIGNGLYPAAPDLAASARYADGELFWIIRNGIKMTGMPAWADHSDEEIWATVAFIKKLPGLTAEEYGKLVMATMQHGGQHPHGGASPGGDAHHHDGAAPGHQHDPGAAQPASPGGK